jgi:hypothetical protein
VFAAKHYYSKKKQIVEKLEEEARS